MYFVTFYKKAYKAKAIQYAYIKFIYCIYMYLYITYIYINIIYIYIYIYLYIYLEYKLNDFYVTLCFMCFHNLQT